MEFKNEKGDSNENATKQEYHWLKEENYRAARSCGMYLTELIFLRKSIPFLLDVYHFQSYNRTIKLT